MVKSNCLHLQAYSGPRQAASMSVPPATLGLPQQETQAQARLLHRTRLTASQGMRCPRRAHSWEAPLPTLLSVDARAELGPSCSACGPCTQGCRVGWGACFEDQTSKCPLSTVGTESGVFCDFLWIMNNFNTSDWD